MINPCARIRSLAANTRHLSPLMGGYAVALSYLIRTRGVSSAQAAANYGGIPFRFRRCDIPAIREVLLDGEYSFLKEALTAAERPVILDIGAHIGLFSIWTFSLNPRSEIYSLEASPDTYGLLSANVASGQKNFHWRVENRAAWGSREEIGFSNASESSMSHRVDSRGEVKVRGVTFSDLIEKVASPGIIDIMKVDIEGAEEAFLCAPGNNLDKVKSLVIELHPQLCDTSKVMALLRSNFIRIEEVQGRISSKPLLYCRK